MSRRACDAELNKRRREEGKRIRVCRDWGQIRR